MKVVAPKTSTSKENIPTLTIVSLILALALSDIISSLWIFNLIRVTRPKIKFVINTRNVFFDSKRGNYKLTNALSIAAGQRN
jgi:hypothetical protein